MAARDGAAAQEAKPGASRDHLSMRIEGAPFPPAKPRPDGAVQLRDVQQINLRHEGTRDARSLAHEPVG